MSKKGVSADEKKHRLLKLFYEKKEFFQLKDLEKIAPKEKGIIANSVKDTLQSLVDDGLVDTDKIGTSIYFWAFPSKAKFTLVKKLENLETEHYNLGVKLQNTSEEVGLLKVGKEKTEERLKLMEELTEFQIEYDEVTNKVKQYTDNDPTLIDKMKNDTQNLKEATNRWTDNIFEIKTWCRNNFSIESKDFDKQFGIPNGFDYIE